MLPWERNLSKDVGIIVSLSDNIGISATVVSVNHKDWISRHQGGERCGHLFSLCAPKISLWPNVPTGRTNLTSVSEQCPRPLLLPRLLPITERCRTEICYLIGASGPFLKHRQIWCDDSLSVQPGWWQNKMTLGGAEGITWTVLLTTAVMPHRS